MKLKLTDSKTVKYVGDNDYCEYILNPNYFTYIFRAMTVEEDETLGSVERIYDSISILPKKNFSGVIVSYDYKQAKYYVDVCFKGVNQDATIWVENKIKGKEIQQEILTWLSVTV